MPADASSSRRRRNRQSGPTSAGEVAQANTTLQHFTGRPQKQWMHDGPTQTASAATNLGPLQMQQPGPPPTSDADAGRSTRVADAAGALIASLGNVSGVNTHSSARVFINPASEAGMERAATHHELPSLAASGAHSGSHGRAAHLPAFPPTSNHPVIPTTQSIPRPANTQAAVATSSVVVTQPPRQGNALPPPTQAMRPASLPNIYTGQQPGSTSYAPDPRSVRSLAPISDSQRRLARPLFARPPPQSPRDNGILSPAVMRQRLTTIYSPGHGSNEFNATDHGRLRLLREAVDRQDMHFIVLSQIHALRRNPQHIPESAKHLGPQCFQYLDRLLCTKEEVSPRVLDWLSTFPAPILEIYFKPQIAAIYEPYVLDVVAFLSFLSQYWDNLMHDCIIHRAPPLVDELHLVFRLPSIVFQATAFRAISREVLSRQSLSDPAFAMLALEGLHQMDQARFQAGHVRKQSEVVEGRKAFAEAIESCRGHELVIAQYNQNRTPNGGNVYVPTFQFSPAILHVFSLPGVPAPHQAHGVAPVNAQMPGRIANPQQTQGTVSRGANMSLPQQQPTSNFHPGHPTPHTSHRSDDLADMANWPPPQQQAVNQRQPSNILMGPSRGPRRLFPAEHEPPRPQPSNPNPTASALHQAHLRSPTFARRTPNETDGQIPPLFRHVMGYALPPTEIKKDVPVQYMLFRVPKERFDNIPKYVTSKTPGEPPLRALDEGSCTYRLRCAAYPPRGFPTDSSWMNADNHWPENLFLELNGAMLEPRRKLHYNRYLPVDLTPHIKAGENDVKIILNRPSNDSRPFAYVLAVEMVGASYQSTIKNSLAHISAEDSIAAIKKSLSNETANDDELSMFSSSLAIKLFDPFSGSKIFDIPVRGSACVHRDCFDLDMFLALCKREAGNGPTVVDCWRCPFCRGDVRPQTLVVDDFLVGVRNRLEQQGLLDTRVITVDADGSWAPKEEKVSGVRSPSLEHQNRNESHASGKNKGAVEVMEID